MLGIDAAWTEGRPSGVAVLGGRAHDWRVVASAPSYDAFLSLARGTSIDWRDGRFAGSWPRLSEIVRAAEDLAGCRVSVVAVDMPLASSPLTERRAADNAISRAFGSRGCSTHSPTPDRPGAIGRSISAQLEELGFPLTFSRRPTVDGRAAIEVYPHPALLGLLGRGYRVPYKVSRSGGYWPGKPIAYRIAALLRELGAIRDGLARRLGEIPFELPAPHSVRTLSHLKRYEDSLDALVCAWVGTCLMEGTAEPFGDASSAVWVPTTDAGVAARRCRPPSPARRPDPSIRR